MYKVLCVLLLGLCLYQYDLLVDTDKALNKVVSVLEFVVFECTGASIDGRDVL
jgi:hypothetical protein